MSSSPKAPRIPVSGVDRAWLRMDEPSNLMIINGVFVFEGQVDRNAFLDKLEDRFQVIDRFRQRVVLEGRRHYWEECTDFVLEEHVFDETLEGDDPEQELKDLVGRLMSIPLPYDRPLWRVHVIASYGGSTALLWRFHHCLGDGIALMLVLLAMTDPAPDPGTPNPLAHLFQPGELTHEEAKEHLRSALPQAVKLLSRPSEVIASTSRWLRGAASIPALGRVSLLPPDKKTVFKGKVGIHKRVAWSRPISLESIAKLQEHFGGTINDVLLTATAGGLMRYMSSRQSATDGVNFRAVVPVSLRPIEEMSSMGNYFGLVFLSLPVGIEDPLERHLELQRRMSKLKRSYEPAVILNLLRFFGSTAKSLQDLALKIFGAKATAVLTSVPGPKETLYFCGQRIHSFFFWVPQAARLGMGLSLLSYAGSASLGVVTDTRLVDDPQGIVDGFHEEIDLMSRSIESTD